MATAFSTLDLQRQWKVLFATACYFHKPEDIKAIIHLDTDATPPKSFLKGHGWIQL